MKNTFREMSSKKKIRGIKKEDEKKILPNDTMQDTFDKKEHEEFSQWCVSNEDMLNALEKESSISIPKFAAIVSKKMD